MQQGPVRPDQPLPRELRYQTHSHLSPVMTLPQACDARRYRLALGLKARAQKAAQLHKGRNPLGLLRQSCQRRDADHAPQSRSSSAAVETAGSGVSRFFVSSGMERHREPTGGLGVAPVDLIVTVKDRRTSPCPESESTWGTGTALRARPGQGGQVSASSNRGWSGTYWRAPWWTIRLSFARWVGKAMPYFHSATVRRSVQTRSS